MKRLKLTEGSLTPFWMKDLEYMQTSFEEVVRGLVRGLAMEDKDIIISGCKITNNGGRISMTSGWCYYGGEILAVDELKSREHAYATPMIKLTPVSRVVAGGSRQIVTGGEVVQSNVYEETYLRPSVINGASNVTQESYTLAIKQGAWDLGERLTRSVMQTDSGMQEVVVDGYIGCVRYRKIGGTVQLYGYVTNDAIGAPIDGMIAGGLPRPAADVVVGSCTITTRGELEIKSSTDYVSLNGIVYLSTAGYDIEDGHYSNKHLDEI